MEGRQLWIELALRQVAVVVTVRRGNRVVITEGTVTQQQLVHDLLTVNRQLERHPQIVVAERIRVYPHWNGGVREACGLNHFQAWDAVNQRNVGRRQAVHVIDIAVDQSGLTGNIVVQANHLHFVEVRAAFFPVVRVAGCKCANPRYELLENVATGTQAAGHVQAAVRFGWTNNQVVIRKNKWEVSIRASKLEYNVVIAILADVRNSAQQAFCRRGAVFSHMVSEVRHDIFRRQRLTVVELNAFAQTEHPRLRVVGFNGFSQLGDQLTIRTHFGQTVSAKPTCRHHE